MIETVKGLLLVMIGAPRAPFKHLEIDARRIRENAAKTRRATEKGKTELHEAFERLREKPTHAQR